jgi:hypothetical protein
MPKLFSLHIVDVEKDYDSMIFIYNLYEYNLIDIHLQHKNIHEFININ